MNKSETLRLRNATNNPAKTSEARRKISEALKGNKYCLGRVLSDETKKRISLALTGKHRTEETKRKIGETSKRLGLRPPYLEHRLSGDKHPNWKGGLTPKRVTELSSPEYKAFHSAVLERDNYTCQDCGARNGLGIKVKIQVHHRIPYSELAIEDRYNPDYGITLCWNCHNKTKRNHPRPNNHIDFVPKKHICRNCGSEYQVRYPGKYCLECRLKICCPVCGSTNCNHSARKSLNKT